MSEKTYNLAIVEANHSLNEFYTLGGAGWRTSAERDEELARIPVADHDCANAERCYILDILDPDDGWSIIGDREISEESAHALLSVDDFEPLREQERALNDMLIHKDGSES